MEAIQQAEDQGSPPLSEAITNLLTDLKHLAREENLAIPDILRAAKLRNPEDSAESYNGWTNYETWVVHLWLTNSYRTYFYWRGQAKWYLKTLVESEFVMDKTWTQEEDILFRLADELRESFEESLPEMEPSVFSDLLRAAISEVSWTEIARAFIDAEQE